MKFESKIFLGLGFFFIPMGLIYGYVTHFEELVGFPAIEMTALLVLMIGFYLNLTGRHIDPRPEDDVNGEISENAGDLGFFAPWSWWPLVLGFAAMLLVTGLAIGWWIFFIGAGIGLVGLIGWVFEFNRGGHAH